MVHVTGPEIIPGAQYELDMEGFAAPPTMVASTWPWGDVNGNQAANFEDIQLTVLGFQDIFEVPLEQLDLDPCGGNGLINFGDIQFAVFGFQGRSYAETKCPVPCTTGGD